MKKGILCTGLALGALLATPVLTACGDKTPQVEQPAPMKQTVTTENFVFTKIEDKKEYELTGKAVPTSVLGSVVIPNSIEGYPVTKVADFAFSTPAQEGDEGAIGYYYDDKSGNPPVREWVIPDATITSITIGSNVKEIGKCAFFGTMIESLEIPASVETIGDHSFYYSQALKKIEFAENPNLTCIDKSAFSNSELLGEESNNSITIPKSVKILEEAAFKGCTNLESILFEANSELEFLGRQVFIDCTQLKSITIPAGVTEILSSLFSGCSALETVIFEGNISSMGELAFNGCSALKTLKTGNQGEDNAINIPDVDSIGIETFQNCSSLTKIIIPNSVETVGANAFANCSSLININLPTNLKVLANSLFSGCSALESITIPASVEAMHSSVFAGCQKLASVTFENYSKLEVIGETAFKQCYVLNNFTIPSSVKQIKRNAFQNCKGLTSIVVPANVEVLGGTSGYVFMGCISLESVTILTTKINTILPYMFNGCSALTTVNLPEGITEIQTGAFSGCSVLTSINLPNSLATLASDAFASSTSLTKINGFTVSYTNALKVLGYSDSTATSITVPSFFTTIGASAFSALTALENLIIPDSITSIEASAFKDCSSLKTINLPANITTLPNSLFENCSSLESITIPANVETMGTSVFKKCEKLVNVQFAQGSKLKTIGQTSFMNTAIVSLELPSSVTDIKQYAFQNCKSLKGIVIPASVQNFGATGGNVFMNCEALEKVVILSNNITTIYANTFVNCSSLIEIVLPASITTISDYAFNGCSALVKVYFMGTSAQWAAMTISETGNTMLTNATVYYYSAEAPQTAGNYWYYDAQNSNQIAIWPTKSEE